MQSKTIRIRNISDDLKINMAAGRSASLSQPIYLLNRGQCSQFFQLPDSQQQARQQGPVFVPVSRPAHSRPGRPLSRSFYVQLRKTAI